MSNQQLVTIQGPTRIVIEYDTCRMADSTLRHYVFSKLTSFAWNNRIRKFLPDRRYAHINPVLDHLYLPIECKHELYRALEDDGIDYIIKKEEPVTPRVISTQLKTTFTPRPHQLPIVDYLKNPTPVRKGLATYTGSGKTVSSIAGALAAGHVTMVVVASLTQQWLSAIEQFTDITPDKLYLVQGVQSLIDLFESKAAPDIIVVSLATLRLYVARDGSYADLPPYGLFIKKLGIGTKIMDEVHLNFHAGTIIDLHSNIANNIYLTATFTSSDKTTRRIFDMIYPPSMRFGADKRNIYIDAYSYGYTGEVNERKCVTQHGYMHIKYEKQMLKSKYTMKRFFEHILGPVINAHWWHKRVPGQKCIIYFLLNDMVRDAYTYLKSEYPECRIAMYVGSADPSMLDDVDILISNPKKSGCGTDIKNLRTIVNTVSAKSATQVIQQLGRLRELPDGTTPEYVEVWDTNMESHRFHANEREEILRPYVRSFTRYSIPG